MTMNKEQLRRTLEVANMRINNLEAEVREAKDLAEHWAKKHNEALSLADAERAKQRFFIQVIHALSEPRRD